MGSQPLHAEINREATRLEEAARVIRREAGGLRYHPVTGLARRPGEAFEAALRTLRESVTKVRGWMGSMGGEREQVRGQAEGLRVALDVLSQTLARPERAPLDAPYGLGAPRRPHPGAQATWAAERAESLARTLARLAVVGENASADPARPAKRPTAGH